jgi:hypothetical protein
LSGDTAPIPGGQSAFGDRYEVLIASPLPEFSTRGGEAFKAKDKKNAKADLYAIVHYPTVPIRNDLYKSLTSRPVINMVNPVDRGLMNVSIGSGKQRLVTIFTRPTGGALMNEDGTLHPRMNANRLRQNVVLSSLKAFAAIHKRGATHRMISPTRMYFAAEDSDDVVIGECYSAPAGYLNPFALEPLELAFADDVARGEGEVNCDYYQLGAALQALYFGEKLWEGRDIDSLSMARVNQGSFWALAGGREIPGAIGTLIRGLMADELDERWGAEEVLDWFEGVGKNKRTSMQSWTMSRPTNFKGVAFVDRRLLANAFGKDPKEAAQFLKSMDFPSWIQQSFRDEIFSEKLEFALDVRPAEGYGGPRADDYKMVARVCMFLYPTGPVFYKGFAFYPSGIPAWFADCFARDDRETMTTVLEAFDNKFMSALVDIAGERNPKLQPVMAALTKPLEHGPSNQLGRGLERTLYELNPILPCVSTRFSNIWIGSLIQLMRALDRLSATGGGKNILLDRHVAAYCATHGSDMERDFNNLAAAQSNPPKFAALTAEFFGTLQKRLKLEPLKHLSEKLVDGLAPAVKGLKNKKRREQVQGALDKLKKGGDISKLSTDVNMSKVQALDAREFSQASNLVSKLEREKSKLTKKILPTDIEPRRKGYGGARIVSFAMFVLVGFLAAYKG